MFICSAIHYPPASRRIDSLRLFSFNLRLDCCRLFAPCRLQRQMPRSRRAPSTEHPDPIFILPMKIDGAIALMATSLRRHSAAVQLRISQGTKSSRSLRCDRRNCPAAFVPPSRLGHYCRSSLLRCAGALLCSRRCTQSTLRRWRHAASLSRCSREVCFPRARPLRTLF